MADIDLCPRCQEPLANADAKSCKCGWRRRAQPNAKRFEPRIFRPCAHMTCGREAIAAIKAPTGWAHVCYEHYLEHQTREAVAWNQARGIVTTEDCIRNCRNLAGLTRRLITLPAEREAGQDDEERA